MKRIGIWVLTAGAVVFGSGSASAILGGWIQADPYIGPLPTDYFEGEACHNQPIVFQEDPATFYQEWSVDVAGVRDDGNPNTFISCKHLYEDQTRCLVGVDEDVVLHCLDNDGGATPLPQAGDRVFVGFNFPTYPPNGTQPQFCQIFVSRSFGEADPSCRVGSGGGPPTNSFPCNSSNSTPFPDNVVSAAYRDTCYSFQKSVGELRISTWTGDSFVLHANDSAGTQFTGVNISSGMWSEITGVSSGKVYFYISHISDNQSNLPIQLHDW